MWAPNSLNAVNQAALGGVNPIETIIQEISGLYVFSRGQDSYSLRAGRSGDRIPVGARFSASVQTGPAAHPTSYTKGTRSFPGVKRPGRGDDHLPPSSAEVEGRVELYICYPSGPSWPVLGRTLHVFIYFIYSVVVKHHYTVKSS